VGLEWHIVANVALAVGSALVLWVAGARLARDAAIVAERGMGQALAGELLLGIAASLSEGATSIAAALQGHPELAVSTLLGGVTFSIVMVAVTDVFVSKQPLTISITHPVVILEAALVILMLTLVICGISAVDVPFMGAGAWSSAIVPMFVIVVVLTRRGEMRQRWKTEERPAVPPLPYESSRSSNLRLGMRIAFCTVLTLIAGVSLAYSSDALSNQTGLGASFIGFVVGGVATSLPELSMTMQAVRLERYEMAFSDAFGTNIVSITLLWVADLAYAGPPLLTQTGHFSIFATALGIALTAVYLCGFVLHSPRGIRGAGVDSILVLVLSAIGLAILYQIR
jgi:cation:H+ antiporter